MFPHTYLHQVTFMILLLNIVVTSERPIQGANGVTVVIHVPKQNKGRKNSSQEFESVLTKILCETTKNDKDSISMSVEPVEPWSFPNYLHCIAMTTTRWLLGRSNAPRSVILCADGKVHYEEAVERMESCFQSNYEGIIVTQKCYQEMFCRAMYHMAYVNVIFLFKYEIALYASVPVFDNNIFYKP